MMGKRVVLRLQPILQTKNRAFSLLEVSLILFLLALVFSLSIPLFSTANRNQLKNLSSRFVNLVSYVRDQASTSNQPYFLYLNAKSDEIFVYQQDSELASFLARDKEQKVSHDQKNSIILKQINSYLSISAIIYDKLETMSVSIRFDPSGFSEIFQITFTDNKNFMRYEQTSVLGSFYVHTTK